MPDFGLIFGLIGGIAAGCVFCCFVTNGCETGPRASNEQGCCCGDGIKRTPPTTTVVEVQPKTSSC